MRAVHTPRMQTSPTFTDASGVGISAAILSASCAGSQGDNCHAVLITVKCGPLELSSAIPDPRVCSGWDDICAWVPGARCELRRGEKTILTVTEIGTVQMVVFSDATGFSSSTSMPWSGFAHVVRWLEDNLAAWPASGALPPWAARPIARPRPPPVATQPPAATMLPAVAAAASPGLPRAPSGSALTPTAPPWSPFGY